MNAGGPQPSVNFDEFAQSYEAELQRGLSLSGESQDFFARRRIEWLRRGLPNARVERALDFGCGTGGSVHLLRRVLDAHSVTGVDTSKAAIAMAHRTAIDGVHFCELDQFRPAGDMDLVYCNGVFHHIPPSDRPGAVRAIHEALRPGGCLSFWENNPWNPGTRFVMSRIPFDRDAITLTAPESRRMLQSGGFEILGVHFLFIFPRPLSMFRGLERMLTQWPIGAQYEVRCRKPG